MEYIIYYLILNFWGALLTWKFFVASGIPAWKAFVPVYRTVLWFEVADRPKWWAIFMYVPIIDNVMAMILAYETLHMFGRRKLSDILWTIATLGGYMGYIAYTQKLERQERSLAEIRRTVPVIINHLLFAVVAAGSVRVAMIEAYNIPSSSMEKSLMVGDYLFVSKMHYGLRLPRTPWALPLMHDKVPVLNRKSYTDLVKIPYTRLPGWTSPKVGDAVVFNVPMDMDAPVDKRQNYVKRCVGEPGQTIEIVDRDVFIDNEKWDWPDRSDHQYSHVIITNESGLGPKQLKEDYDLIYFDGRRVESERDADIKGGDLINGKRYYISSLTEENIDQLAGHSNVLEIVPQIDKFTLKEVREGTYSNSQRLAVARAGYMYGNPNGGHHDTLVFPWTVDNYGPFWIPKKGESIELNWENFLLYRTCITDYEGHELVRRDGQYFLDGEQATSYTFEMDYYWMMGDNRHNSEDSRYWGPVPEDHIMGKPVFIFWSWDSFAYEFKDRLRWRRMFTVVHGEGEPRNYLWLGGLLIIGYLVGERIYKRRQANKS